MKRSKSWKETSGNANPLMTPTSKEPPCPEEGHQPTVARNSGFRSDERRVLDALEDDEVREALRAMKQ